MDVLPIRPESLPATSLTQSPSKSKENFAGFDAIRAFAALGVVLLHACVPYLQNPMPGLSWPVRDTTSRFVDCLFWGIELFIMPIFLLLAGFLAWQTFSRRGPQQLLHSRAKRLLWPLLFGMIVVLPLDCYTWVLGWVTEGHVAMIKLKSLKIDGELGQNMWGLSHLWFMQYLILYVAVFVAVDYFIKRFRRGEQVRLSLTTSVVALLATGAVTLAVCPEVVWGFQHAFLPVPSKWIYSGTFFFGGLLLAFHDPRLIRLGMSARRMALPTIVLVIATVALGRWQLNGGDSQTANLILAAMTTASAWLVTLTLIGLATKQIQHVSVAIKYLAAASFWIYLVHHPILGLAHTDLKWLLPTAPALLKTLLAFAMSVGVSLLTYEGLVRKTALGRRLGFAWTIPDRADESADTIGLPQSQPQRRAA